MRLPKYDDRRSRRLESGEEEKLLESADPMFRRLIIVAIETAMRKGEIFRIRRSHIDYQRQTLFIPTTKTDKPRTIALSTGAVEALKEQIRSTGQGNVVELGSFPVVNGRIVVGNQPG